MHFIPGVSGYFTYVSHFVGLTLRSQEIGAAKEAWPVGIFGLVCSLIDLIVLVF